MIKPKIVITGPGRAGTSLLMQLLDGCGQLEKGSRQPRGWNREANAGYELPVPEELALYPGKRKKDLEAYIDKQMPQVIKDPRWTWLLPFWETHTHVCMEDIIVMTRDLSDVYRSRKRNHLLQSEYYNLTQPEPGFSKWYDLKCREMTNFVIWASRTGVRVTLFDFDTLLDDPELIFEPLLEVFPRLDESEFFDLHSRIVVPRKQAVC